ncbi:hypothetical protein BBJ28_00018781 [Nothophytophthora sp. Chile5]|nr:hypothetical protein BBJ28_00018781 [Nothophytophthora sp. Chile5]
MYGSFDASSVPPLPDVSKQDIPADVAALRSSFATGATKQMETRISLLKALQHLVTDNEAQLAEAAWKDMHKNSTELYVGEVQPVQAELQYFLDFLADWMQPESVATNLSNLPGRSYIRREPLGVACIVATWNYPLVTGLLPLVPALGAGNCVLLRLPGDDTSRHMNNVLIELFDKYMDKRYVRYVYGGVEETKAMLRERFDIIFATGGHFMGKIVAKAAAEHLTPIVLELGGKSPCIIDETADLALAATRISWGAFHNGGQTCIRPDYLLVDAKHGDRFVKLLEEQISVMYGAGPAAKESPSFGRVINQRMFDRVARILETDRKFVSYGGETDLKQRYIAPTVLNFRSDLTAFTASAAMREEIFGPLLPVYYYTSGNLDEAIDFITAREKPLALYHFSDSGKSKERVICETSAGGMVVNDVMMHCPNLNLPFGGVGHSGMGSYHGHYGFEAFTHRKAVLYRYGFLDLPQRYAPYTPANDRFLRLGMKPVTRLQVRMFKLLGVAALVATGAVAANHFQLIRLK